MDWTRLPLSRSEVDRAAHLRTGVTVIDDARAATATRVVLLHEGRLATRQTEDGQVRLDLRRPPTVPVDDALWVFLGVGPDGVVYLAADLPDLPTESVDIEGVVAPGALTDLVAGATWSSLREVGSRLDARDAGLATTAVGLAAWHSRHPRCPRCGSMTEPATGGWTRRCAVDGSDHYPRTDPAVIMAVLDADDRLLLGHAAHWPEHRFSTLAGYVEPGESIEAAVRREVAEEVGVSVGDVTYKGSQPWPFPASLMLAFTARALTTDLTVDGVEVTEARWFTRAELAEEVSRAAVLLPMRTSVARALIEEWFGGELGGP
ncbi:NAD(+) diphosphatase [Actinotalea sp. K2]|uniref:NAD(+) diphosphatase n=1 Tax=Actinotalea sp. K2 TaxID=2939438 RepID=UPI0020170653|nr:NAD(+) diphosphatase [Actinotalea sp. K2]MCL3859857.1 NAD(+) diphosphatase [Actinotalea sp. K2]